MAVTIGGNTPWTQEVAKTAAYQVTAADSGTLFTNNGASGSVTFTLPTLANGVGCCYWFHGEAAQTIVIAAPTGKLYLDGSITSSNGTYSTSSHIIGSMAMVYLNAAGTFWVLVNMGATTVTAS